MKPLASITIAASLTLAPCAYAGGLDRAGQNIDFLFEQQEDTPAERQQAVKFDLAYSFPALSGSRGASQTGDIGNGFFSPSFSYKRALGERFDFALIYDRPFGADVTYSPGYILSAPGRPGTLRARATADALTGILRYRFKNGVSAYAGLRLQSARTSVDVPSVGLYSVTTDRAYDLGYLVGVAYERPSAGMRIALTYNSRIDHDFNISERLLGRTLPGSVARISTPQSVNLDFRTGIADDWGVFGRIRWVDWPQTSFRPTNYPRGELVGYATSTVSYRLGIGHKFNGSFRGAIFAEYEDPQDSPVTDLGPTDGYWSVGIGGTYTTGNTKFSAGINYRDIGDATTRTGAVFTGNSAVSVRFGVTRFLN